MTDKILIERSVVEQALEALEEADLLMDHRQNIELRRSALVTLRAALEQPQESPYGECDECGTEYSFDPTDGGSICVACLKERLEQPQVEREPVAKVVLTEKLGLPCLQWLDLDRQFDFKGGEFLYTHPQPPRQPLVAELQDAFFEGFCAVETYNDVRLNSVEEEWKKYKTVNRLKEQEC